jgi:Domain of unknown function (DUF4832)
MHKLSRLLAVLLSLVAIVAMSPLLSAAARVQFYGQSDSNATLTLDNFESYADTAALQAAWQFIDNPGIASSLDLTNVHGGTRAMHLANDNAGTSWVTMQHELPGNLTNWMGYSGIEFWAYNEYPAPLSFKVEFIQGSPWTDFTTMDSGTAYLQKGDGTWAAVPFNGNELQIPAGFRGLVHLAFDQYIVAPWQCTSNCPAPNLSDIAALRLGFSAADNVDLTVDSFALYTGTDVNPSPTPYPTPTPPGWPAHSLTYTAVQGTNPLKGFMPFSDPQSDSYYHGTDAYVNQMPHSMEFFYIPLKAVMRNYNSFDWHALDDQLREIARRHHQAVVRFYLDYPDKPSGIPQFLLDAGLVTHAYSDYNNGVDATSVIPNYDDPHLLTALDQFIAAFGARYNGDPRIGFIQIGLIGFWGEWHTYPFDGYSCNSTHTNCPNYMPNALDQSRVLHDYNAAFHKTKLLLRYPMADSYSLNMGYHDDSFALETLPPGYGGQSWMFVGKLQAALLDDVWHQQPIGGELRPEIQVQMWQNNPPIYTGPSLGEPGQDWNTCVALTHPSWFVAEGLFAVPRTDTTKWPAGSFDRALQANRQLGYEFYVPNAYFANSLQPGDPFNVGITMQNTGIAPFYYGPDTWPIQLGLQDRLGRVVKTWTTTWDLRTVQPANNVSDTTRPTYLFTATNLDYNRVQAGAYTVVMRVVNPLEDGMPLNFANAEQGPDGWLNLGMVNIANRG